MPDCMTNRPQTQQPAENQTAPGGTGTAGSTAGCLPGNLPFALPVMVRQGPDPARYSQDRALENGTLFPDLNLPFHLKVNAPQVPDTPLNQLRALDFVILELGLYLDTHPYDAEAFALFQHYVELEKTATARYVAANGPLTQCDAAGSAAYTWGKGPWPWQYDEEV